MNKQLEHKDHQPSHILYNVRYLAHNIDTPGNVGSLFRLADALGIEHIHLCGYTPVPPHSKIRKTSRAADAIVPFSYTSNPLDVTTQLRQEGFRIISLELSTTSIDIALFTPAPHEKICLVLGAEGQGVSTELLNASDQTVHIPMLGQNSSMNVATACAIASYHITRYLTAKPRGHLRPT